MSSSLEGLILSAPADDRATIDALASQACEQRWCEATIRALLIDRAEARAMVAELAHRSAVAMHTAAQWEVAFCDGRGDAEAHNGAVRDLAEAEATLQQTATMLAQTREALAWLHAEVERTAAEHLVDLHATRSVSRR